VWDATQSRLQAGSPLLPREVAHVFLQLCSALAAMHALTPALAHRDVKPHNILLREARPEGSLGGGSGSGGIEDGAHFGAAPAPLAAPPQPAAVCDAALPGLERCDVVLMDFGSAAGARVEVTSRGQAVALQEDAEVNPGTLPLRPWA
jgi:serine/threonine protein kinase